MDFNRKEKLNNTPFPASFFQLILNSLWGKMEGNQKFIREKQGNEKRKH
jgi:hypothetical protein